MLDEKLLLKLLEEYFILIIQKTNKCSRNDKQSAACINASELADMTPEGQLFI